MSSPALLVRVGAASRRCRTTRAMSSTSRELLERLAQALSPEDVQLYYQTAIIGRRDLRSRPIRAPASR